MAYSFKLYNREETELWELPYTRINITEELNKGLDGSLSIPYPSLKRYAQKLGTTVDAILAGNFRSWRLYKDDDLLYRGVLSHRSISGGQTGATNIVVNFTDYVGLLGSRYTALEDIYQQEDSSDIAWSIINDSQSDISGEGDLGITRGANPTTVNRDRTFRRDQILNEIVKMSRAKLADGFDFDIDNTLQFNVYYPAKGTERPEIVFNEFNIVSWSHELPLTAKLANRVHVLGQGFGQAMITATREEATPMATWGLLEAVLSEKSVSTPSILESRGDRFLERRSEPRGIFSLTTRDVLPDVLTYSVGDTVRVEVSEIGFSELLRINSRSMSIMPSGQAVVNLTFEEKLSE